MSSRKLGVLQAGRGMAAVMVLLFHSEVLTGTFHPQSIFNWMFNAGWCGVDFFFVLSGFLMMSVHKRDLGHPSSIASYLQKRALRIFPIYWALCGVVIPCVFLVPSMMKTEGKLSALVLMSSILLIPHQGSRLIGVTWTLEYELVFYALFTLFLASRKIGSLVFAVWGSAILLFLVVVPANVDSHGVPLLHCFPVAFLLNVHCVGFILGILTAVLVEYGVPIRRPVASLYVALSLFVAFLLIDTLRGIDKNEIRYAIVAYALLTTAVVFFSVVAERRGLLTVPPWLQELGAASYSIYLTHYLVIAAARVMIGRVRTLQLVSPGLVLLVVVPLALVPGFALHRVVERPLMDWIVSARLPSTRTTRLLYGIVKTRLMPKRREQISRLAVEVPQSVFGFTPDQEASNGQNKSNVP